MYKNVTGITRKMAIPAAHPAADDTIIMAIIGYQAYINTLRNVFNVCVKS